MMNVHNNLYIVSSNQTFLFFLVDNFSKNDILKHQDAENEASSSFQNQDFTVC